MFETNGGKRKPKKKTHKTNLKKKNTHRIQTGSGVKTGRCLTSVKLNSSPSSTCGMVVFPCATTW